MNEWWNPVIDGNQIRRCSLWYDSFCKVRSCLANSSVPEPRARSKLVGVKPSRLSLSLGRSTLTNGQLEVILAVERCKTSQELGRRNEEREGDVLWTAPSKHHRIVVLLTASLSICYSVPLAQQQVTLILEVRWSRSDWRFGISFLLLNSSVLVFDLLLKVSHLNVFSLWFLLGGNAVFVWTEETYSSIFLCAGVWRRPPVLMCCFKQ